MEGGSAVKHSSGRRQYNWEEDVPTKGQSEKKGHGSWRLPRLQDFPKGSPPVIFSEFGSQAKNLLYKGFQSGHSISVTGVTPVQVLLSTVATKMDELVIGLVTTTITPAPGALVEFSSGTTGVVQGSFSWNKTGLGLGANLEGSFPLAKSGKAALTYRHQHFTLQGQTGLHAKPPVDVSMTLGGFAGDLTVGAEAGYSAETGNLTKLNAGVGLTQGNVTASAIYDIQNKKGIDFVLSQSVDPKLSVAAQYSRSVNGNPDIMAYGVQYQPDVKTTVKGRFDNTGKVAALLQHEFRPNSLISIQAEWETGKQSQQNEPKIGINVNIMP